MKTIFKQGLWISLFILSISCSSTPQKSDDLISSDNYEKLIDKNTRTIQSYDGLYNIMQFHATLLTPQMYEAVTARSSQMYQWDDAALASERQKAEQYLSNQTEVVLSFYTPEAKHDNLNRSKTLWKIFLDAGGKRYEGKATKMKLLTSEIQSLYPYHNRWSTPYKITFPVSMKSIEASEIKFTLTGAIGSESVTFNPTQQ